MFIASLYCAETAVMSMSSCDEALLNRVNALDEMSPSTDWLEIVRFFDRDRTNFQTAEKICDVLSLHPSLIPTAVSCIAKRLSGHTAALQLLLILCSACSSSLWWQQHNFHQICLALCMVGTTSQRVLSAKCLQAMCLQAASNYACLRTLHNDGTTEWALRALKRHATKHDRPELFSPSVSCLSTLLDCKGAREQILSGKVPAMLQQIHSSCRLGSASVNAYSSLLRSMQLWLFRPKREKRVLPSAAPQGAVEASKAFHHLQKMAADSGMPHSSANPKSLETDERRVEEPGDAAVSSCPSPKQTHTEAQDRQLQDLRDAGLDVDALPPSLLHLFMDGETGRSAEDLGGDGRSPSPEPRRPTATIPDASPPGAGKGGTNSSNKEHTFRHGAYYASDSSSD